MFKKALYIAIILFCLFIINNLIHSIYDLWQKQSLITQTRQELEAKQAENLKLKNELAQAQTKPFIEQEARDKLFLIKPGEQEVIIPSNLLPSPKQPKVTEQTPHWQEWINILHY